MKLTVELEPGETPAEADEKILKALLTKQELKEELSERYHDPALNEFHDQITTSHIAVLDTIKAHVESQLKLSKRR